MVPIDSPRVVSYSTSIDDDDDQTSCLVIETVGSETPVDGFYTAVLQLMFKHASCITQSYAYCIPGNVSVQYKDEFAVHCDKWIRQIVKCSATIAHHSQTVQHTVNIVGKSTSLCKILFLS